jgi:hypothetical protein
VTANAYLLVMLSIIGLVSVISVPSLFLKKCPKCGKRNLLDAVRCKACQAEFPEEEDRP